MKRSGFALALLVYTLVAAPCVLASSEGRMGEMRLVDAIAVRSGDTIEITFSDQAFDRAGIAGDRRFDILDRDRHETDRGGYLLALRLDADGSLSGLGIGGSSSYTSSMDQGLTLEPITDGMIRGRFEYDEISLRFDAPLWIDGDLPRVGERLPADGGASGKALRDYLAAVESGNFDAFVALSPPQWRESMNASKAKGEAQAEIDAVKSELPDALRIIGGHVEAERAWIDLSATRDGKPAKAVASIERNADGWYVRRIDVVR